MLFNTDCTVEFPFSFSAYTENLFPVSVQEAELRVSVSVTSQSYEHSTDWLTLYRESGNKRKLSLCMHIQNDYVLAWTDLMKVHLRFRKRSYKFILDDLSYNYFKLLSVLKVESFIYLFKMFKLNVLIHS